MPYMNQTNNSGNFWILQKGKECLWI